MSILFRNSKSSVRLNNDTKTREARELWNVREVVGPSMENFGTGNLPSLVCNFSSYSFLKSLVQEAIVICFIAAISCINQTELQFFFLCRRHFTQCLSRKSIYIFFFTLPLWNFEEFSLVSLPLHFILYTDESDFALSLVLRP